MAGLEWGQCLCMQAHFQNQQLSSARVLLTTCRAYPNRPLQSDAWRPLGRRFGGVTLAGHPGAVATVEATWVPLASGSLPVPVLSLQASSRLGGSSAAAAGWGAVC